MENTTIAGIIITIIVMIILMYFIFRKPRDAAPSLESAVHINEESQKPVIPRHVRDQLQVESSERVEPILNEEIQKNDAEAVSSEGKTVNKETPTENDSEVKLDEKEDVPETKLVEESTPTEQQTFSLNNNIDKAEIEEFNEESTILDAHLHEQNMVDDECALVTAESFIAFNIVSKGRVLSGEKTLKILLKYGLRFGEMKCFHRYNDDGSKLLFSVLKLSDEGTEGFDLEILSTEEVKGLACFLALPHSDVQNAFDTMVSIAGLIAREIDGVVYDQENYELTPQLREYWRHQAIDYKSQKSTVHA